MFKRIILNGDRMSSKDLEQNIIYGSKTYFK